MHLYFCDSQALSKAQKLDVEQTIKSRIIDFREELFRFRILLISGDFLPESLKSTAAYYISGDEVNSSQL